MIALTIGAAAEAVSPVKVTSISPNGWITAVVGAIGILLGSGGVYGIFKGLALMVSERNKRTQIDNDAAAVVRGEMMQFNEKLQLRIDGLETAGREDRRKFDEEMSNLRKAHADEVSQVRNGYEAEIRILREEITGLRRQMAQWQRTSGVAQELAARAPTAAMKRVENSGLGDVLRTAFDMPGTDGEL